MGKVTGFLGGRGRPSPITDREAERILHQVQEGIDRPKPSIVAMIVASPLPTGLTSPASSTVATVLAISSAVFSVVFMVLSLENTFSSFLCL